MKLTDWQEYESVITPLTYYCGIEGTTYECQVVPQGDSFTILTTRGSNYNDMKIVDNLDEAKHLAVLLLNKLYLQDQLNKQTA